MSNKLKLIILVLVVLLSVVIYLDYSKPKPIDWTETYDLKDKIPFGLYVFDKEAPKLFKADTIKKINKTLFEFLRPEYNYDSLVEDYKVKGTVLAINGSFPIDDESCDELLVFVSRGNNAFISTKNLSTKLMDSLKIDIREDFDLASKTDLWLANKSLGAEKQELDLGSSATSFSKIDTLNTTVLGYQGKENKKYINYIKVKYFAGFFYLHLQPAVFTNYYLLKNKKYNYTEKALSYIPESTIFWLSKSQNGEKISDSKLRFIFSQPALKWAWSLFISGILIFMIFNAKRKQRIVPIVAPLPNTSVDFTKTIANLYYQEGDYQNIINKKIVYFLEKVRHEYLIDTTVLDDKFINRYQLKTGKNADDISNAVKLINYQRRNHHESIENDLTEMNTALEKII